MGSKIEVSLQLCSLIRQGTELQRQEQELLGELYDKNGTSYIRYREQQEEGAPLQNTFIIKEDEITLIKEGTVRMKHSFQLGKVTKGRYDTPLASFEMGTKTTLLSYQYDYEKEQGSLQLNYDLWLNQGEAGSFELSMNLTKYRE